MRAMIRAAKLAVPASPRKALESIILGKFTTEATDGKTLISTTEGGGTATFAFPSDFGPAEVMALAEEAIEWLDQQPDPDNPDLRQRRILRLRASFDQAVM